MAADCGGTNSRLMLYRVSADAHVVEKEPAPGTLIFERKYLNVHYKSLEEVIRQFFQDAVEDAEAHGQEVPPKPEVACLAVAGVVLENQCRLTNLDWLVAGKDLERNLGIKRVLVINDFVVQGFGVLTLDDGEVMRISDAEQVPGAPIACLGAGTGLGVCYLTVGPSGHYECYPSEGGHGEWAPRGAGSQEQHMRLLKFLKVKFSEWNRVSVERVVSGRGICNVYEFLAYEQPEKIEKSVHRQFLQHPMDASIIAKNAFPGSLCEQALNIFVSCYGAEAGVIALQYMPFRGLYLTGGVTMKTLDLLLKDDFIESYQDKGRVSPVLQKVPLYIVMSEDMGKRGAHLRAVRLLQEHLAGALRTPERPLGREELVAPRDFVWTKVVGSEACRATEPCS